MHNLRARSNPIFSEDSTLKSTFKTINEIPSLIHKCSSETRKHNPWHISTIPIGRYSFPTAAKKSNNMSTYCTHVISKNLPVRLDSGILTDLIMDQVIRYNLYPDFRRTDCRVTSLRKRSFCEFFKQSGFPNSRISHENNLYHMEQSKVTTDFLQNNCFLSIWTWNFSEFIWRLACTVYSNQLNLFMIFIIFEIFWRKIHIIS